MLLLFNQDSLLLVVVEEAFLVVQNAMAEVAVMVVALQVRTAQPLGYLRLVVAVPNLLAVKGVLVAAETMVLLVDLV